MLTDRQRMFVDQLVGSGCSLTEAARQAGYHDGPGLRVTASRLMKRPEVHAYLMQRVEEVLSLHAARAVNKLGWLVTEAKSERVQLDASRDILDRAGFRPMTSVSTQLTQDITVAIDLA